MKLSVVLWGDACQVGGVDWTNISHDRYPVLTVGIIAKETDETLTLARDNDGDRTREWRAAIAIPKVLILKRRDYTIASKMAPGNSGTKADL